jgi:hypothetical protein
MSHYIFASNKRTEVLEDMLEALDARQAAKLDRQWNLCKRVRFYNVKCRRMWFINVKSRRVRFIVNIKGVLYSCWTPPPPAFLGLSLPSNAAQRCQKSDLGQLLGSR